MHDAGGSVSDMMALSEHVPARGSATDPDAVAMLEREVLKLRAGAAEARRNDAAIALERAAIDVERAQFTQRLHDAGVRYDVARAAWDAERAALSEQLRDARRQLAAARRLSPRHHLGVAVHRFAARHGRDTPAP